MIKQIFTDLDGVIRTWDNHGLLEVERRLGVPANYLFSVAFSNDLLTAAITGEIDHEQWLAVTVNQVSRTFGSEKAYALVDAWKNSRGLFNKDVVQVYRDCFPDANITLVTNATSRLMADINGANMASHFDHIINSAEIGVAKPQAEFFEKALSMTQSKAQETLFLDDAIENITAAEQLGFNCIHVTSIDAIHTSLAKYC